MPAQLATLVASPRAPRIAPNLRPSPMLLELVNARDRYAASHLKTSRIDQANLLQQEICRDQLKWGLSIASQEKHLEGCNA